MDSCSIKNLSPGTEYNVTVTSWLGGQFSDVGSSIQRAGKTKPAGESPDLSDIAFVTYSSTYTCKIK